MKEEINQGDILKVEGVKMPIFVVSKDFFNQTRQIIGCPVYKNGEPGALHIHISTDKVEGNVHCESMKLFDVSVRGYSKLDRIHMPEIIDITDTIQGIFDYV